MVYTLKRRKMLALSIIVLTHFSTFLLEASHSNLCHRLDEISYHFSDDEYEMEFSDEYLAALSNQYGEKKGNGINFYFILYS